jgi:hypothetical protein
MKEKENCKAGMGQKFWKWDGGWGMEDGGWRMEDRGWRMGFGDGGWAEKIKEAIGMMASSDLSQQIIFWSNPVKRN